MFHAKDDDDGDGEPERGPLDMCPEDHRGNVLMMLMAGGDEKKFRKIKYKRRFSESWLIYAQQACAFWREPYKAPEK